MTPPWCEQAPLPVASEVVPSIQIAPTRVVPGDEMVGFGVRVGGRLGLGERGVLLVGTGLRTIVVGVAFGFGVCVASIRVGVGNSLIVGDTSGGTVCDGGGGGTKMASVAISGAGGGLVVEINVALSAAQLPQVKTERNTATSANKNPCLVRVNWSDIGSSPQSNRVHFVANLQHTVLVNQMLHIALDINRTEGRLFCP